MDWITEPSFRIVLQIVGFLSLKHPFASLPLLWPVAVEFGLRQTVSCLYQRVMYLRRDLLHLQFSTRSCGYTKSFDENVKKA